MELSANDVQYVCGHCGGLFMGWRYEGHLREVGAKEYAKMLFAVPTREGVKVGAADVVERGRLLEDYWAVGVDTLEGRFNLAQEARVRKLPPEKATMGPYPVAAPTPPWVGTKRKHALASYTTTSDLLTDLWTAPVYRKLPKVAKVEVTNPPRPHHPLPPLDITSQVAEIRAKLSRLPPEELISEAEGMLEILPGQSEGVEGGEYPPLSVTFRL